MAGKHAADDGGLSEVGRALEGRIELALWWWQEQIKACAGAQESLRFLASKAKLSKEGLLRELLPFLWPYAKPPARKRFAEVRRLERFASTLREVAKTAREDPVCGLWAGLLGGQYRARGRKEPLPTGECPAVVGCPELEGLPEMLERYASSLEKNAGLLRHSAKREPTRTQYQKDSVVELLGRVKQLTNKEYREKVMDLLRAAGVLPALDFYNPPNQAETVRQREYRQRKKFHPA